MPLRATGVKGCIFIIIWSRCLRSIWPQAGHKRKLEASANSGNVLRSPLSEHQCNHYHNWKDQGAYFMAFLDILRNCLNMQWETWFGNQTSDQVFQFSNFACCVRYIVFTPFLRCSKVWMWFDLKKYLILKSFFFQSISGTYCGGSGAIFRFYHPPFPSSWIFYRWFKLMASIPNVIKFYRKFI